MLKVESFVGAMVPLEYRSLHNFRTKDINVTISILIKKKITTTTHISIFILFGIMYFCTLSLMVSKGDWDGVSRRLDSRLGKREVIISPNMLARCCKSEAPLHVIEKLVHIFPAGTMSAFNTKSDLLPLHIVCETYKFHVESRAIESLAILDLIIIKCPKSLWNVDKQFGRTSLHMACCRVDSSLNLIEQLLESYGSQVIDVLLLQDKDGLTCLHLACLYGASLAIIKTLVELCPQSINISAKDGRLPLHCICLNGAKKRHINYFAKQLNFYQMISSKDKYGLSPFQYACEWSLST